jgi:hypothetical protein
MVFRENLSEVKMSFSRLSNDQAELEELQKLAAKGIKDEELEEVISDYIAEDAKTIPRSFEFKREIYKREKSATAFEQGVGGFKR